MERAENHKLILEGLRSGVPYRALAKKVVFGRERYIDVVCRIMEAVEQDRAVRASSYVVRANYGEGKTHLLHSLWGMAEDRGWAVSLVSISKETPLDRLDYLYPKLIQNTYLPGSSQPGIQEVVKRALTSAQLLLPEARVSGFSERTLAVLECLVAQNEGFEEMLNDLSGEFLGAPELKRIYRKNFGRAPVIPKIFWKDEAASYLRLLSWLIHKAGYGGWLILLDEVELIGKLGKGARSQAYANIGRLLDGQLVRTVSVLALAANYHSDVLIRRGDREQAPLWLATRPRLAALVSGCEAALEAIAEARLLEPLSPAELRALVGQILDLHQTAYGWTAPVDADGLLEQVRQYAPTQDARLRTCVRLALTILDIWFQYGEAPVIEFVDRLQDAPIDEEPLTDHSRPSAAGSPGGETGDEAADAEEPIV